MEVRLAMQSYSVAQGTTSTVPFSVSDFLSNANKHASKGSTDNSTFDDAVVEVLKWYASQKTQQQTPSSVLHWPPVLLHTSKAKESTTQCTKPSFTVDVWLHQYNGNL